METPKSDTQELKSAAVAASPEPAAKPSEDAGGNPSEPDRTVDQIQKLRDLFNARNGELGHERDAFKADAEAKGKALRAAEAKTAELEAAVAELKADIDSLGETDPENAGRLAKRLKSLEAAERTAKEKEVAAEERVRAAEADRAKYAGTVNYGLNVAFESSGHKVADEYEGADGEKLIVVCDEFGIKAEADAKGEPDFEQLEGKMRKVADVLWAKKSTKATTEPILVDSGVTSGGGVDISKLSSEEKITEGLRRNAKKK